MEGGMVPGLAHLYPGASVGIVAVDQGAVEVEDDGAESGNHGIKGRG